MARGSRALSVKKDTNSPAVKPMMENVLAGRYPISRFFFWYFAGQPVGAVKAFARWVLSEEGQGVVENVGYYPLNKEQREVSAANPTGD